MTDKAQQEAERLIERFQNELSVVLYSPHNNVSARQCAIIHCEELINAIGAYVDVQFYQSVLNILKQK